MDKTAPEFAELNDVSVDIDPTVMERASHVSPNIKTDSEGMCLEC
jgi:hypothetical protein